MKKRRNELLEIEITHIEQTRNGVFAEAVVSGSQGARRISFLASAFDPNNRPGNPVEIGYCIQHPGDADNRRLAKAICTLRKASGKIRIPLGCCIEASSARLADTILNELGGCLSPLDETLLRLLPSCNQRLFDHSFGSEATLIAEDPVQLAQAASMYFRTGLRPWNPTRYEVQAEKALFARFSPQTKVSRPGNPVSEKEREKLIAQGHAKRSERAAGRQAEEETCGDE